MVKERILKLREWMKLHQLSAFIIPSADPHQGEYIAAAWKSREWISGFTGSAGTVVVTLEEAGLWTDSRYFIQAEAQLQGSGIRFYKSFQQELTQDIPTWLLQTLAPGSRVGVDGNVCTCAQAEILQAALAVKGMTLATGYDPMPAIWTDRPTLPMSRAVQYEVKYAGRSAADKLTQLREELNKQGADTLLVTPLEEIAWVLNIRGNDVEYNPVLISYLLVERENATLFVDPAKCPEPVVVYLKGEGVEVQPYTSLHGALSALKDCCILLPPTKTSIASRQAVNADTCTVLSAVSPLIWMKCIRTKTEIEGLRRCMERDGAALVNFQYWLLNALRQGETVTELSLSRRLREFRAGQDLFRGESFNTIAGYGAHAASPHYSATPESDAALEPHGYILLDSGGQYLDGTTDITRTLVLGPLTEEEKIDYTCVLKGNIGLSSVHFPKGTNGTQLDVLARAPLWAQGLQFLHGTGHGVGCYLCVHEATDLYQFRMNSMPHPLMLDSVITNEPAVYKPGSHGARIENILLVSPSQTTQFGDFYSFETLTLCPIDTEAIIPSMLTLQEVCWLNEYHAQVYVRLFPLLETAEREWLQERCKPLAK